MLARHNRITETSDFDAIKENGKLVNSESFSISFIKRNDNSPSRFGFIVSSKISNNAAIRTKAKRSMSEGVRFMLAYIQDGIDCVFLAKPNIAKKFTQEILDEVKVVLAKAKLLKN